MKFAANLPAFGDFADPRVLADLAKTAEEVGWDGFFIWDHIFFDPSFHPMVDPWVGLAAVATATKTLRIGTMITPIPRRRPWKLSREIVSLDQLSNGRLTLGVGLGDPVQWDFGFFHDETDNKKRAKRLDEGLEILTGLWKGETFSYHGEMFQVEPVRFLPRPVQQPRIPIWVAGGWPNKAPMRRAARYDGFFPLKWHGGMSVENWREAQTYIQQHRTTDTPMDWVHGGTTPGDDPRKAAEIVAPFAEIGITWWNEAIDPWRFGLDWEAQWTNRHTEVIIERVKQGPPRL
jgi:alkanesulfonate monooxygenase SsuD/methylene tetrahydromethanopterin reductase-like flavin-dependent oxidoreductase (luciferase family)